MRLIYKNSILALLLFLLSCVKATSQDTSKFVVYFNPIGIKLNNIAWEEFGLGYYEIENNLTNNISVLGMYKKYISKRISLNIGLGVRQNKYNFDYIMTNPFDNNDVVEKVNRFYHRTNLVPHFGISWDIQKFEISIGYELPFELFSNKNIETKYFPTQIFIDLETQDLAYYRIVERNRFTDDLFRLASPVLMCDYLLSKKISVNFTSLIKPYGNLYVYQLDIKGETGQMTPGEYQLNDSRINNYNICFFLGFKYSFK